MKGDVMKAFEKLTEDELIALTEDDIQRYIDYACAEAGVPLLPACPAEPPAAQVPEPDQMVYVVGNIYGTDVVCVEQSDANELANFLNRITTVVLQYVPGPSTDRSIQPHTGPYLVKPQPAYSAPVAETIRPALNDAQRAKAVYDKAKKEYDAAVREREAYTSEVREAVEAAHEMRQKRSSRRREYERYLELANGSPEIARRFLVNARSDAKELLPELFTEAEPQPA